jgi:hypothetical protein
LIEKALKKFNLMFFYGFDMPMSKMKNKKNEKKIILIHFQLKSTMHCITKHTLKAFSMMFLCRTLVARSFR